MGPSDKRTAAGARRATRRALQRLQGKVPALKTRSARIPAAGDVPWVMGDHPGPPRGHMARLRVLLEPPGMVLVSDGVPRSYVPVTSPEARLRPWMSPGPRVALWLVLIAKSALLPPSFHLIEPIDTESRAKARETPRFVRSTE